jgi:hypothetical protein
VRPSNSPCNIRPIILTLANRQKNDLLPLTLTLTATPTRLRSRLPSLAVSALRCAAPCRPAAVPSRLPPSPTQVNAGRSQLPTSARPPRAHAGTTHRVPRVPVSLLSGWANEGEWSNDACCKLCWTPGLLNASCLPLSMSKLLPVVPFLSCFAGLWTNVLLPDSVVWTTIYVFVALYPKFGTVFLYEFMLNFYQNYLLNLLCNVVRYLRYLPSTEPKVPSTELLGTEFLPEPNGT